MSSFSRLDWAAMSVEGGEGLGIRISFQRARSILVPPGLLVCPVR